MKLWNRLMTIGTAGGGAATAVPAMIAAVEHFNDNTDYDFALWQGLLGGPVGSCAVSTRFESYGEYTAAMQDMNARPDTLAVVGPVTEVLAGGPEDSVWSIIHAAGDVSEVPNTVANIINRFDIEQMPAAVAQAIDFADFTHELSGTPATVCTSIWGTGPTVRIIWGYSSVTDFEQRTEAAMASPAFAEKVAANASGPRPADSQSGVAIRIA